MHYFLKPAYKKSQLSLYSKIRKFGCHLSKTLNDPLVGLTQRVLFQHHCKQRGSDPLLGIETSVVFLEIQVDFVLLVGHTQHDAISNFPLPTPNPHRTPCVHPLFLITIAQLAELLCPGSILLTMWCLQIPPINVWVGSLIAPCELP